MSHRSSDTSRAKRSQELRNEPKALMLGLQPRGVSPGIQVKEEPIYLPAHWTAPKNTGRMLHRSPNSSRTHALEK